MYVPVSQLLFDEEIEQSTDWKVQFKVKENEIKTGNTGSLCRVVAVSLCIQCGCMIQMLLRARAVITRLSLQCRDLRGVWSERNSSRLAAIFPKCDCLGFVSL